MTPVHIPTIQLEEPYAQFPYLFGYLFLKAKFFTCYWILVLIILVVLGYDPEKLDMQVLWD